MPFADIHDKLIYAGSLYVRVPFWREDISPLGFQDERYGSVFPARDEMKKSKNYRTFSILSSASARRSMDAA